VNVVATNTMPANAMTALTIGKGISLNSAEEMEAMLRHIGATRYHSLHPFHGLLHGGRLNKGQVQAWALNRYYYQSTIPLKDATVISRFRDRATRIEWRHRIEDHDGNIGSEGGIERWLKLTEGLASSPRRALRSRLTYISAATRRRWRRSPLRSPNCSRRTCMKSASRECSSTMISSIRIS
jgi:pyrroloquinoline quinone (PQQ) biosynthesis protein C